MKSPEENTYFLLVYIHKTWLVYYGDDGQAVSDCRSDIEEARKAFVRKHPKGYSKIVIGSEVFKT